MSRKNSNGVLQTLAVVSESVQNIKISKENVNEILDNTIFLSLFDNVPDFRDQVKIKYKLSSILLMSFIAIIEEKECSFLGIEAVIEDDAERFTSYGLIENGNTPSHDTIRRIFTLLDSQALIENTLQGFYLFLEDLRRHYVKQGDYRQLCGDGKEICGSGRAESTKNPSRNTAMFNIYEPGTGTVIQCIPIDKKENEIPVFQKALESLDLRKTVITADALHCQKETAEIIQRKKGIYVITVKDNQRSLHEEIHARMNKYPDKVKTYKRGTRTIEILSLPKNYALRDEWAGLTAYARMKSPKCVRCFITNAKDEELIMQAIENRWAVETFHKLKDKDLGEDAVRSTDKRALNNIAVMNNLAQQLIKIYQSISPLEPRKAKLHFRRHTVECLNTILSVMSSEEIIEKLVKDLEKRKRKR